MNQTFFKQNKYDSIDVFEKILSKNVHIISASLNKLTELTKYFIYP